MGRRRIVVLAGLFLPLLFAVVLEACGETEASPPPASGPDGSSTVDAPSADTSSPPPAGDGSVPTPSVACPTACAEVAASWACVGKTYKEDTCLRYCPCMSGAFRSDIVRAAVTCVAGCRDGGEDNCIATAASPYANDPQTIDTANACSARQRECREAGTSLGTDVCAVIGARPEFLATLRACLPLPCAEARACVTKAYTDVGCGE
jgi:hypothetical protein